jgi:glycerophosphoryl diester phosphodiesterase
LGLKVIPWTINDADTMRAQIEAGADGIITDYPTRLRAVMAELGMTLPPSYHLG